MGNTFIEENFFGEANPHSAKAIVALIEKHIANDKNWEFSDEEITTIDYYAENVDFSSILNFHLANWTKKSVVGAEWSARITIWHVKIMSLLKRKSAQ